MRILILQKKENRNTIYGGPPRKAKVKISSPLSVFSEKH
jgi:hypothetical protein